MLELGICPEALLEGKLPAELRFAESSGLIIQKEAAWQTSAQQSFCASHTCANALHAGQA